MNRVFPLPFYTLAKLAAQNGGVSFSKSQNLIPWLIKTTLFEPMRWAELAFYNKKINQHTINKHPLFILGYYRSGTSYLHQCFTQDNRFGYHNNFQMVLPEAMLTCEKSLLPLFEFLARFFKMRDYVHRLPLSFRFPGEEDATMTTYLSPEGAQWGYFFPGQMEKQFSKFVLFENISQSEKERWERRFLYLLKKISLAANGRQLVLKSPPNTARIKVLLSLFPNARFVFIHRNPYEIYASNKRFWDAVQRVFALKRASSSEINEIILNTYSRMMHRYLEEKKQVPADQLIEVSYNGLVTNTLATIDQIYGNLRLNPFSYCREQLRSFIGHQKEYVMLNHQMPEVEKVIVAKRWEPFFTHWNYPID